MLIKILQQQHFNLLPWLLCGNILFIYNREQDMCTEWWAFKKSFRHFLSPSSYSLLHCWFPLHAPCVGRGVIQTQVPAFTHHPASAPSWSQAASEPQFHGLSQAAPICSSEGENTPRAGSQSRLQRGCNHCGAGPQTEPKVNNLKWMCSSDPMKVLEAQKWSAAAQLHHT